MAEGAERVRVATGALASMITDAAGCLRPGAAWRPPWERSVLDDVAARRPWNLLVKAARVRARTRLRFRPLNDGVTVLIVSWNTREVLADVVSAIRRFSPPDTRILVVDTASTDGTREELRTWSGIETMLLPANVGHGVALDLALCMVRTRITVTLDSDAIPLRSQWLTPAVDPVRSGRAVLAGVRSRRGFAHPMYLAVDTEAFVRQGLSFQVHVQPGLEPSDVRWGDNAWDTAELMTPRLAPHEVVLIDRTENAADGLPGMTAGGVVYHHGGMSRATDGGLTAEAVADWRSACRALGVDIKEVEDAAPVDRATFVYRGQLTVEQSRVEFLLAAVCRAFTEVDAVMLSPGMGATAEEFEAFARVQPNVRSCTFVEAGRWRPGHARRALRRAIAGNAGRIVGVGFSVAPFLPQQWCRVWCVNGIPEERLLHRQGVVARTAVRVAWRSARRYRPDLTVVVSDPMAKLMTERIGGPTLVIPNAVDRSIFRCDSAVQPRYLTYQGGGSPWQGLGRLAEVWWELHRLDPALRFRVVTRDPRAHVLADRLPSGVVDVQATSDPNVVADLLREARLGFLMREPNLVNEVSWPMKLGEYLAAGAPVVVTRCGWDAEHLIARHGAGLVVDWRTPPLRAAHQIIHYLDELGADRPPGVGAAAEELDELRWLDRLGHAMRDAAETADNRPGSGP